MELKIIIALLVVVLIVVGINGMLLISVRKKRGTGQIQLLQKALNRARDPWHAEDEDLAELSRLVADLKPNGENQETQR